MRKLFTIKKEELHTILDSFDNIVSKKSPDVQHSSVKIKVGDKIEFICKNFESYFCKQFNIQAEEQGVSFVVGADILANLVKQLESPEISFFHKAGKIVIIDQKSQFTLDTMQINYAEREIENFRFLCNISCKTLLQKINLCLLKLENGMFSLNFGPSSYFIARDNRKLAIIPLEENTPELSTNLTINIIEQIKSICSGYNTINIHCSEKEILFQTEDCFLICKNHWSRSINYLELCRTDSFIEITFSTDEIKKTLKKLKLMASSLTNAMDLEFFPNRMVISVFNPSVGNAREEITCSHSIQNLRIKLNISHFINVLQLIKSNQFSLFVLDHKSKVIIRSEAIYLLMPLTF
jgi:DNA polymerase III sliding clamp (beta) subunit (PCNA family)